MYPLCFLPPIQLLPEISTIKEGSNIVVMVRPPLLTIPSPRACFFPSKPISFDRTIQSTKPATNTKEKPTYSPHPCERFRRKGKPQPHILADLLHPSQATEVTHLPAITTTEPSLPRPSNYFCDAPVLVTGSSTMAHGPFRFNDHTSISTACIVW